MADGIDTSSGEIVITAGGVEKFSTLKKKVLRVPTAAITLSSYAITFPDLTHTYVYNYWTNIPNPPSPNNIEQCSTKETLSAQEWGPAALGFGNVLADINLGAAPSGTDFVEVKCKLSRTTAPQVDNKLYTGVSGVSTVGLELYNHEKWPIDFVESQWMNLSDASLVCEKILGFCRMFWFEIVGGNVTLRRKQSVSSAGFWTTYLDSKGTAPPVGNLTAANVNGTGCRGTSISNYSSVYTGDFVITPCVKT